MSSFDFDKHFEQLHKSVNRGMGWVFFAVVLQWIVALAVLGLLAWVAIHFIAKFW